MEILPKYNGLIRQDATVLLRPKTALKDMLLEVDPGEGRPVPDGGRLPVANTSPDIDPDEIFASLDGDTRSYLKILISSAGQGLEGRGEDLRQTLLRLEPLHRDLARLNGAVAGRRASLKKLIRDYGEIVQELDGKDAELVARARLQRGVLRAGRRGVQRVGHREQAAGGAAPTATTLSKVETLGDRLGPALNALRPPFRRLDETNAKVRPFVREAAPIIRNQIRPFTRRAKPYVADLGLAARYLAGAARPHHLALRAQPLLQHRRVQPRRGRGAVG